MSSVGLLEFGAEEGINVASTTKVERGGGKSSGRGIFGKRAARRGEIPKGAKKRSPIHEVGRARNETPKNRSS